MEEITVYKAKDGEVFTSKKDAERHEACLESNKKVFSVRINAQKIKKLKYLSADTGEFLGDLLEEAIQDIVEKYN